MRKQLTPFFGMLIFAAFMLGCQKEDLVKIESPDATLGVRANAEPVITFNPDPGVVGQDVTVNLEFGTCGSGQLQEEVPPLSGNWVQVVGNTNASAADPDITYTFVPTTSGECAYRFRAVVSGGMGCTDYTGAQPGVCLEVVSDCPECFEDETGWSDGPEYAEGGNWATYTEYGEDNTVTLYADQIQEAGTVHFSAVVDGMVTITITLEECWEFDDVAENVKIQGYSDAPTQEPVPGLFANKSTADDSPYSVDVPAANFYGVHVDLLSPVECED